MRRSALRKGIVKNIINDIRRYTMSYFQSSRSNSFLGSLPEVTKNLLIINVLVWVATMIFKSKGVDFNQYLALHFWQADRFMPWQLVTYMFMHDSSSLGGGLLHLGCNMFNLFMFGALLERVLGTKRYLLYYMMCGIGAGLVQEVVWQFTWETEFVSNLRTADGAVPSMAIVHQAIANGDAHTVEMMKEFLNFGFLTVGASGAVFGLLLAFGMTFPNLKMYIIPFPFPIKAKWMVIGYGVFELLCGTTGMMSGVAHYAHLGGMVFGVLLLLYWRQKGMLPKDGWYDY